MRLKKILRLVWLAPVAALGLGAAAQTNPFENEIRTFELADQRDPPPPNSIVFVGSSTFARWNNLSADFPDYRTLNRGFGGSQTSDVLFFFDRIIAPYRPPLAVLYEGDNDLAAGKSVDAVFADWTHLVARVEAELPNTHLLYVSVKPSPSRAGLLEEQRELNDRVREHAEANEKLHFADTFTPMLDEDGRPRTELFVSDRLHLNESGYALWQSILGPALDAWAEAYPVPVKKPESGELLIDFGSPDSPSGGEGDVALYWNNLTAGVASSDSGVLTDLLTTGGNASTISLRMVSRFNGANESGTADSAAYPASATRDSLFGNTETFGGLANVAPAFRVEGLDPAGEYRLTFYASRLGAGDNRETRYTVTGETVLAAELNPANNIEDVAVISNARPDPNGVLTISLSPGPNNNNGNHFIYLGVLQIDSAAPSGPSFLVDFGSGGGVTSVQDGGLRLSWNNLFADVAAGEGAELADLVGVDGAPTPISLEIVGRFNAANQSGAPDAEVFPGSATSDSLFGNTEAFNGLSNVAPVFKIKNLNPAAEHDFTFYASRLGVNDNRETRYAVRGATSAFADLNAANNVESVAVVTGIRPDDAGEITIALTPGPNNNNGNHFVYLGALRMQWTVLSPDPAPALAQPAWESGRVGFFLHGVPGMTYDVQSSADLRSWQPAARAVLTNSIQRIEIDVLDSHRFFRALR